MKLEDQVCSLEYSRKLKELGVEQESIFRWQDVIGWSVTGLKKEYIEKNNTNPENYSAFTVSELGEMLPEMCGTVRIGNEWEGLCDKGSLIKGLDSVASNTEADARAKIIIYLLEKGISPNDWKIKSRKF